MASVNPKRSALYLLQQQTLPVPPAGFVELNTELAIVPTFQTIETNRITGAMNSKDSTVDTCRASTAFTASANIRRAGPGLTDPLEIAELLKVSGFEGASMADTYVMANSIDSVPRGSGIVYMDGNRFSMTNTLVGSTEIDLTVGELAVINTELSGYLDSPVPSPEPNPIPTLNNNPLLVVSCADIVQVDGTTIPATSVKFTTNPEITNTYTMGGVEGLKQDTITDYSLMCAITFPVDALEYGREAGLIEAGTIGGIRVVLGADATGTPVDGESVVFLADTSKAVIYSDEVAENLLSRTVTFRLYDNLPTNPALGIITGTVAGL